MNSTQLAAVLVIGIILIKAYWLATEVRYFKERIGFSMFKTNFIEALILIVQIVQAFYFPLPRTPMDKIIIILGVTMYTVGFLLAVWARVVMNSVWGIPGLYSKNQTRLVTTGPFALSRNPMYVGFVLLYVGFAVALRSWLVILRIPLIFYFYKSALKEEKILEKKFGQKYLEYKANVPLIF